MSKEKARLNSLYLPEIKLKSKYNGLAQDYLDAKYPFTKRDKVKKLDLSSLSLQGELNLEGFTNLKSLDCSDNKLINLDISNCENFKYLNASNN